MSQVSHKTRLLIYANDPAGANVTMAYAKLYKDNYSTILAFCTSKSFNIYKEHIPLYICDDIYRPVANRYNSYRYFRTK